MLVYKIHPAIGVARVGDSPDAFFVGPETPGAAGVEIDAAGAETPVTKYKSAGRIKRQAARFRVFEYDRDAAGVLALKREITAAEATITWRVDLVNRKAALDRSPPHNGIDPRVAARPRNVDLVGPARAGLVIRDPRDRTVSGANQPAVPIDQGQFLGTPVYLGELRTDRSGRLMILGGRGVSASSDGRKTVNFANNDRWHDDVGDGPVTARIRFPGQPERDVDSPAWVTVAPPDFAPGIGGIVTLLDVAFQAAIQAGFRKAEAKPTFRRHILPVIRRARDLRFVNDQQDSGGRNIWDAIPDDFAALGQTGAGSAALRGQAVDAITPPEIQARLTDAIIPDFLRKYLDQYRSGDFFDDATAPPPPATTAAEDLDRAALEACVGLNFFPGIEASQTLRGAIYAEAFRIDHRLAGVFPGFLSEVMAVPWQADFRECETDWWPSQRPDVMMTDPNHIPSSQTIWARGIATRDDMVARFGSLSFVVAATAGGQTVFVQES